MRPLVIKLTAGAEQPETANQALTVASAAVSAGAPVSLWLTGEAVWFAVRGKVPDLGLAHALSASELMAVIGEAGQIQVCTQCAARRGITEQMLEPPAVIAGALGFVEQILGDTVQALVY